MMIWKNTEMLKYAGKRAFWLLPYQVRRLLIRISYPRAFRRLQEKRLIVTDDGYSFTPFDQYRCIYIHIPKTAGLSVSKSLFGNAAGGHRKLEIYQIAFSKREFDSYFKFTFVRNPWDRLVSAYYYLKNGGINDRDRIWAKRNLSSYVDFDSFVKGWVNRRNIEAHIHFIPQFRFICEPGSYTPKVDFIGYFENLEEDFCYVQKRLGLDSSLMHFNKTIDKQKDYNEYYTEATKEIVAKVYRKDIQLFGYDFDNISLKKHLSKRSN